MSAEERAEVLVTARLLRAAAVMQWLALALTVLGAAVVLRVAPTGSAVFAAAAVVLGLVALYYAVRVSFDAKLFEDIAADRLTTAQLDAALGTLSKGKAARSWPERCRGARGLVVKLMLATVAQAVTLVLGGWG